MVSAVALIAMSSTAFAGSVIVGLCDGQMSEASQAKSKPGSGTISAACVIPAGMLSDYAGMNITKIRFAIAKTDGLTDLQAWVRDSVQGVDLGSASVSSPSAGWNEVSLSSPVVVPEGQDLAIGYSFNQQKSCKTILLGGPDEDNDYTPAFNGCWIGKNGTWENRSETSGYDGSVCVELVIEDDRLPATNLSVALSSKQLAVNKDSAFAFTAVVTNLGEQAANGYQYTYSINGGTPVTASSTALLTQQAHDTINVVVPASQLSRYLSSNVTFTAQSGDNTANAELGFAVYGEGDTFDHHLLLEEFSTEECPNCERAIKTLDAMRNEGFEFNQITHHCGYKSDFLTVPADKEYEWLYGNDGTYAPAAMLDRDADENYPRQVGMLVPVMSVGYANDFRPILQYALAKPAFVSVEPSVSYDPSTHGIAIHVDVNKNGILDVLCSEPRLSVVLIEDSVPQHHQAGYSSDSPFRHGHVYRETISSTWGDAITWNGNNASADYSVIVPEYWTNHEKVEKNPSTGAELKDSCIVRHLEVVAFVNAYNPEKRSGCRVFNSGVAKVIPSVTDGIASVSAENASQVISERYYNVAGQESAVPYKGLNIIVRTFTNGRQEKVKVINK